MYSRDVCKVCRQSRRSLRVSLSKPSLPLILSFLRSCHSLQHAHALLASSGVLGGFPGGNGHNVTSTQHSACTSSSASAHTAHAAMLYTNSKNGYTKWLVVIYLVVWNPLCFGSIRWCVWSVRPSSPLWLPHLKCLLCYVMVLMPAGGRVEPVPL